MSVQCWNGSIAKLSAERRQAAGRLWDATWPSPQGPALPRVQTRAEQPDQWAAMWLHGAEQDGQVVAVARSFQRTVRVAGAERVVLGLAGVCTDAAQRGRGYGRLVVEAAFARLTAACPVCLFQTQVPGFYTGLGAREIVAEVVNSASDERAFWDPHVMIYPATASWPAGTIDLLGPGW